MRRLAHAFAAAASVMFASCENPPTAPAAAGGSGSVPVSTSAPATSGVPLTTPAASRATFTFSVDTECSSDFPESVRQRSYSGAPAYAAAEHVALGGAVFERSAGLDWNIVYRSATDNSSAWWFQDPPIWERLSDDAYLLIYGTSEYRSTSAYGEWPFWGVVTYCSSRKPGIYPECAVREISCTSTRHRLGVAQP